MHFFSDEWKEHNFIELSIYIHEVLSKENEFDIQINCIRDCKYWSINAIQELCYSLKYIFKEEIGKLNKETFYALTIKQLDYNEFQLNSITELTDSNNELDHLH